MELKEPWLGGSGVGLRAVVTEIEDSLPVSAPLLCDRNRVPYFPGKIFDVEIWKSISYSC